MTKLHYGGHGSIPGQDGLDPHGGVQEAAEQ